LILLLGNIGLLYVDHIHFQYNGLLFGILLLSIGKMVRGNFLQASLYFAILLNMKHIFLYLAPVYFFYLLRYYCLRDDKAFKIVKLLKTGSIVITVFLLSFGPFYDQLPQVFSRLFPFKRGLSHAYWAPNFWALYNFADKILSIIKKSNTFSSNTRGLVQTFDHVELPSVQPIVTFAITLLAMTPCLVKLSFGKFKGNFGSFVKPLVICALTSFMFGWHVHEKAILMVIIPLILISWEGESNARYFIFLSTVGHFSLFPLLFKPNLTIIKLSMFLAYTSLSFYFLKNGTKMPVVEKLYLLGLGLLFLYEHVIQYSIGLDRNLPFLPLMLTSVYCALGISYFWLKFYCCYLFDGKSKEVSKKKIK
jgi:alpha-1,3-glucosyltransferase